VEPVTAYSPLGLNLFFDGDTKAPGISAVTSAEKSKRDKRPFTEARGRTMRIDASMTPGAGTLVYARNGVVVELIGFRYQDPSVEKPDFVSRNGTLPNGTPDVVGSITLRVIRRQNGAPSPSAPSVHILYKAGELAGQVDGVSSPGYSSDGKYLLTVGGTADGAAKFWTSSGKELFTFRDSQPVTAAMFSPDGKHILASLADCTAAV